MSEEWLSVEQLLSESEHSLDQALEKLRHLGPRTREYRVQLEENIRVSRRIRTAIAESMGELVA